MGLRERKPGFLRNDPITLQKPAYWVSCGQVCGVCVSAKVSKDHSDTHSHEQLTFSVPRFLSRGRLSLACRSTRIFCQYLCSWSAAWNTKNGAGWRKDIPNATSRVKGVVSVSFVGKTRNIIIDVWQWHIDYCGQLFCSSLMLWFGVRLIYLLAILRSWEWNWRGTRGF